MSTQIIETRKLKDGRAVRLQKRGGAFDVIRTSAHCWLYVEKAVSEQRARDAFFLLTTECQA